jgi:Fe(3+) dicitrate transport protein
MNRNASLLIALSLGLVGSGASLAAQPSPAAETGSDVLIQPRFEVVGKRDRLPVIGGSADTVGEQALEISRVFTVNEALRRVPGITVRDEEGFGLRPNIGIRGLNPTRTTKLTLLEDGLPLAYAPYGDNASYYHPPIDRFAGLEVLKGAHTLFFGPQTIGGVINYLTPDAPRTPGGYVQLAAGTEGYFNGHVRVAGHGALVDYVRKQGDGARDNLEHQIDDLNFKYTVQAGDRHTLTFRASRFLEDSMVTYSGLTQAEFERLGARYNPFRNDHFDITRTGVSLTHQLQLADRTRVTTSVYHATFDRDWWRQSSSSQDGQHGAGALVYTIDGITGTFLQHRLAGRRVDPDTQFPSAQGRLRYYETWGVEPRLSRPNAAGEFQAGLKYHREDQDRRQVNAASPTGRTGALAEDNLRETTAWSAFAAQRLDLGAFTLTPILRYEAMDFDRLNRLNGVAGASSLDRLLPGLGATWRLDADTTAFASIHRGFAPPRVEDVIGGAGTATDVEAEDSINLEAGVRTQLRPGLDVQASVFRYDFDNLIAVGSIAGGGTPLSQGEALFQGAELGVQARHDGGFRSRLAYTWQATAEQSTPFLNVATKAAIPGSVAGNRQPYAPEHLLTAAVGWSGGAFDLELEAQHVGVQFTDFANTVAPAADGQRGEIAGSTVWNASVNYRATASLSLFATVKNLADKTFITDRTRGIQVGMPRLLQAGARYTF